MKELINKITSEFGPAGNEEKIREFIQEQIEDKVDDIYTDNLGNLIAKIKGTGNGKKIMLAAHMDQIGLMVTHIDDDGFLRFTNIGGVNSNILVGKSVIFSDGTKGTIGIEKYDDIKNLKMSKLYIDIGVASKEEAQKKVSIGDSAVYAPNFNDNGERITSTYQDDRIGCYVLVDTIEKLAKSETPHELYFVFTAQEEVGARGAKTAAFHIEPDIGIAVDVTGTGDTPEAPTMDVSLGEGTAIKVKDSGSITHPWIKELLVSTAEEHSINYQLEVLEYGGTDAMTIHTTKGGIPSGTVSIPCRYIHTPGETVDLNDVRASVDLLTKLLENEIE